MTEKPKGKSVTGFLILLIGLIIYSIAVAAIGDLMVNWPTLVLTLYYVIAGIAWIFPAVRILKWALTPEGQDPQS